MEHAFNEKTNPRYGQLKKLILDAITRDRVQEMDYMTRDVYYKFKVRCIAKTRSKAVVAAYLRTFDSDQDVEQRDELMKYSKALYATYQHVNVLYPKKDASERIFSRANFQTAHQLGSLRSGIRSFAEKEVYPEDQARYLRFFDLDTLEQRMTASGKDFVQQPFRISDDAQDYAWKAVRITRIPSVMEEMYLYTIQEMSEANIKVVDAMAAENPGLLEQEI